MSRAWIERGRIHHKNQQNFLQSKVLFWPRLYMIYTCFSGTNKKQPFSVYIFKPFFHSENLSLLSVSGLIDRSEHAWLHKGLKQSISMYAFYQHHVICELEMSLYSGLIFSKSYLIKRSILYNSMIFLNT